MQISRSTSSSSSSPNKSSISAFYSAALRRKYLSVGPIDSHLVNDEEGLVRGLSLTDLILIGIGASISAGILVVTGTAARDAGPGVAISFILAGAACILNALFYAELSSCFPATVGGAYMYSYTVFKELYSCQHLHKQVSIVSQEPILFNCSIEENIAYGLTGNTSSADIENFAKMAILLRPGIVTTGGSRQESLCGWISI